MKGLFFIIMLSMHQPVLAHEDINYISRDSVEHLLSKESMSKEETQLILDLLDSPALDFQTTEHESIVLRMLEALQDDSRWGTDEWRRFWLFYNGLEAFFSGRQNESIIQLQSYVELADSLNMIMGMESPLSILRTVFGTRYSDRLNYYHDKLEYYERQGPKENLAVCYHALAGFYYFSGNYNTAIRHYLKAAEIFKGFSNHAYLNELAVIGFCYADWGNEIKALEYLETVIDLVDRDKDVSTYVYVVGAKVELLRKQKKYLECEKILKQAIPIAQKGWQKHYECIFNLQLAVVYLDMQNPERSLPYIRKAEQINNTLNKEILGLTQPFELDYTWFRYFRQLQDFENAEAFLLRALNKSSFYNATALTVKYLENLIKFYKERGEFEKSTNYALRFMTISDSLAKINNSNAIAKYELEKLDYDKSLEIAKSEQKRRTNLLVFGFAIALMILVLGGLYSRMSFIRKSRNLIRKEKDRSEALLLNILPEEIAEELKEKGYARARNFNEVSVLFTDFVGFTKISESLTATELVEELNACFKAFDLICEKYGIEKIKTIGDAYMAAGGMPIQSRDSAQNTVLAAIEMQEFITHRRDENLKLAKPAFDMRAGVNTGVVVAGIVGLKKFQYDIWGDTVNTASRMESNGAIGRVNISEQSYLQLKSNPKFRFEYRGELEAKGKGALGMYFVYKK